MIKKNKKEKDAQVVWNRSSSVELEKDYPFFKDFIKDINWHGDDNKRVLVLKSNSEEKVYRLQLYSEKHKYTISVRPTYIGAGLSNRYFERGETWYRGCDLPDGPCEPSTVKDILYAILACEILPYEKELYKEEKQNQ